MRIMLFLGLLWKWNLGMQINRNRLRFISRKSSGSITFKPKKSLSNALLISLIKLNLLLSSTRPNNHVLKLPLPNSLEA
jgi:hypothetical protein